MSDCRLPSLLPVLLTALWWVPQPGFAAPSEVIYVVRRGWHIDVGFAAPELGPSLQLLGGQFPNAHYVFFGFGDKHYLLAKNRHGPVLLAALWPGPGMILATAVSSTPQAAFGEGHVIALEITPAQAQAAQGFISQSLINEEGRLQPYAEGPYENSLYFAARPKYSALFTCNTWVAQVLNAAHLFAGSGGVIFAGQVWRAVKKIVRLRASLPTSAQLPTSAPKPDFAPKPGSAQLQGGLEPF